MTKTQLKNYIGIILFFSHLSIMLCISVLFLLSGFLSGEMISMIIIILPPFSIFTIAIFKHFSANSSPPILSSSVTKEYFAVTCLVPSLLLLFIVAIILLKVYNIGFATFGQFTVVLGISETALAMYIHLVIFPFSFSIQHEQNRTNIIAYDELTEVQLQQPYWLSSSDNPDSWHAAIRQIGLILHERLREVGNIPDINWTGKELVT